MVHLVQQDIGTPPLSRNVTVDFDIVIYQISLQMDQDDRQHDQEEGLVDRTDHSDSSLKSCKIVANEKHKGRNESRFTSIIWN